MKKIISTYLIFAFMLMTFSGCERIKNSLGLVRPAPPSQEELIDQSNKSYDPDKSRKARNARYIFYVAAFTPLH
jgi:hypothetical protein